MFIARGRGRGRQRYVHLMFKFGVPAQKIEGRRRRRQGSRSIVRQKDVGRLFESWRRPDADGMTAKVDGAPSSVRGVDSELSTISCDCQLFQHEGSWDCAH